MGKRSRASPPGCAKPPPSVPERGCHRTARAAARESTLLRREWDSNPRWVAPHTLSRRADSSALASLPAWRAEASGGLLEGAAHRSPALPSDSGGTLSSPRFVRWRPGPVQRRSVNQVRAGRQQPSADTVVCRRSPGRHLTGRGRWCRRSATAQPVSGGLAPEAGQDVQKPRHTSPLSSPRGLPIPLPPSPASPFRRGSGPGARRSCVAQRRAGGPRRSRLPLQRAAWHGQDHVGADPRQGLELRTTGRRRAMLRVPVVPRR